MGLEGETVCEWYRLRYFEYEVRPNGVLPPGGYGDDEEDEGAGDG